MTQAVGCMAQAVGCMAQAVGCMQQDGCSSRFFLCIKTRGAADCDVHQQLCIGKTHLFLPSGETSNLDHTSNNVLNQFQRMRVKANEVQMIL